MSKAASALFSPASMMEGPGPDITQGCLVRPLSPLESMSDPRKQAELERQREARRPLFGTWPPKGANRERSTLADLAATEPDAPVALRPVTVLPRVRHSSPRESSDPSTSELLAVGSLVGKRYVIEQHISSGGFGAVYRASDRDIRHHQVALKLLHHRSASDDERQGALRELRLLATVTHPSVVQFKEYGWHEGRLWFAMPWYRGRTLDRILEEETKGRGMSRADARPLFTRLAHGLAAMHAVGIHHHDIKPENIFVAEIAGFPGGLPVLLDLGIATQRGEHPVGLTVEYASPETAAAILGDATRTIGGAADVYSLALVLRNMLDPTLAKAAHTSEVKPLLRARATQPAALSQKRELAYLTPYFRRWLDQDPNQRPTAAELAVELSILTEPEEKRQARARFVQRVAPGLCALGLMVSGLAFQLNRKETDLVVQRRALEHERREGEALRKQAAAQLEQLDVSARTLGDERRTLKRTLAFAHTLNERLSEAATRYEELERRHGELTVERNDLWALRDRLTLERDTQVAAQAALLEERDALVAQRDGLDGQLAQTSTERDDLKQERARLTAQLESSQSSLNDLDARLTELKRERDRLNQVVTERDQRVQALASERAQALTEVRRLEAKLAKAPPSQVGSARGPGSPRPVKRKAMTPRRPARSAGPKPTKRAK